MLRVSKPENLVTSSTGLLSIKTYISCFIFHQSGSLFIFGFSLNPIFSTNFIILLQLGHATDDLTVLTTKTVVDPMKKLNGEFASVALALKKRDAALR